MSQFASQDPKPTLYELERYSLFTPVPDNNRASLNWSIRDGYPRITVFTRTASHKDGKGFITVPFDIDTFTMVLSQFSEFTKSPGPIKAVVDSKTWPRDESGKITGDKETRSRLYYGKDEEGLMWLLAEDCQDPSAPKLKFTATVSDFHEFRKADGTPLTASEGSCRRTQVLVENLKRVMIPACISLRDTSIPRPQRTYGKGNQSKPKVDVSAESFDDINF